MALVNPWMTALQAALGGASGYLSGRAEEKEDEEKRKLLLQQQARQAQQDKQALGSSLMQASTYGYEPYQQGELLGKGESIVNVPGFGPMVSGRPTASERAATIRALGIAQKEDQDNRQAFEAIKTNPKFREYAGITPDTKYEDVKSTGWKNVHTQAMAAASQAAAMERASVIAKSQAGMGSFITGVDPASGQPTILYGTREGNIRPTPYAPEPKAGAASTRSKTVALKQAEGSLSFPDKFEEETASGKRPWDLTDQMLVSQVISGNPITSPAAEVALNKKNPGALQYAKAVKAIAAAEMSVMGNRSSKYMLQTDLLLSGVGPGASAEQRKQASDFRHNLVDGLREEIAGPAKPAPNAPVQDKDAMRADLWDRYVASGMDKEAATARVKKEIP